ncbi:MAG TPA: hypothetical protein PKE40_03795 [Arachnia sp.]|nr:hypothetical protein [Arachnia sp.]HMT85454.1 hypothetical protein [Arachnia sp.]
MMIPFLVIAAVSATYAARPISWTYIDLSMFGGLARESLAVTGPLVACAAALVAHLYARPGIPFASPVSDRGGGLLQLRLMGIICLGWGIGFSLPFLVGAGIYSRVATGGRVYLVEQVVAVLAFWFFVTTGFLLGMAVRKWYSVIIAPLWGFLWVYFVPVFYAVAFGYASRTNIEYFLFLSLDARQHVGLALSVIWVIIAWWLALIASVSLVVVAVARWRALDRGLSTVLGLLSPVIVFGGWILLVNSSQEPFLRDEMPELVCVTSDMGARVCGVDKQAAALESVAAAGDEFYRRIGGVPEVMDTMASAELYSLRDVLLPEVVYPVVFSDSPSFGGSADQFREQMAMSFAGIEACEYDEDDPYLDHWPLAITGWLLVDYPEDSPVLLSRYLPLLISEDDQVVRQWFWDNADLIAACAVTEGP